MKKLIIGISGIICVFVVLGSVIFLKNNRNASGLELPSYNEYTYADTPSGALVLIKNPKYLSEIIDNVELIIRGEVIGIEYISLSHSLEEGTPERTVGDLTHGNSSYIVNATEYIIKVSDIIKGDISEKEITILLSENVKSLSPDILGGDSFVFFLNWQEHFGKYIPVHPKASYFKIKKDNRIIPMYKDSPEFYDLENTSYTEFKKNIQKKVM